MNNNDNGNAEKITALYCRLSVDDRELGGDPDMESNSIKNQKTILEDYCNKHGITNYMFFADDGVSGTTFNRPDFLRMERMIEAGEISTVIVKDLSRFGREQVEMGRLTQVVYPSLGVTFISLQENVNSRTGAGMEMMPFYNIFNEWYASQTSQKIRQVWKTKSEHGERVSSTVAFGYKRSDTDPKQWVIDEPAAEVVKRIYALCLDGKGPMQIAKLLQREKVLVPTAYYDSIGRKHSSPTPADIYGWDSSTVVHILSNRQYTGCAVNFMTTTVSYKVHKTVYNPEEKQQIIPDMQEAIIPEDQWLRVQELRENRIRPTATGRTSLFSGKVFCADCGAKLHFCAAKSLTRNQEFYRCANYKDGRGPCKIHFIRNVVLERLVLEAISDFVDFVRGYEPVLLYLLAKKHDVLRQMEHRKLVQLTESGEKRINDLDRLISGLYSDFKLGYLSEERYKKLMLQYENEQQELVEKVQSAKEQLASAEQKAIDLRLLLKTVRELTDVKELTPTLVNSLIERIEVHNNDKYDGHCHVKVDIYFTVVGMMSIPDENEIRAMIEEIKNMPKSIKLVS
ncbi:MAG: recombinase family protein [Clostridiales bacterium]|nr:recombinase family protein [Clostridiales bacterium]